jgi:hypothetical protein
MKIIGAIRDFKYKKYIYDTGVKRQTPKGIDTYKSIKLKSRLKFLCFKWYGSTLNVYDYNVPKDKRFTKLIRIEYGN